jgi:hypothetical protein
VATPGTSSITLNWSDNSGTNETGFHIWRSTDNTNWGSVYGTTGQNVATFTDNSPGAGVGYYYKVTAYNGAGDSSSANMSFAVATVIAYEGFNYTPGTGANWNGQSGGVGFSSAWTVPVTTSSAVVSGSLAYTSGSSALLESGNSVSLHIEGSSANRTVNTTFGTDDTSLWVGFVLNQHITGGTGVLQSSLWLGNDSANHIELGSPWNGFYDGQAFSGGNRLYWSGTGVAPTDGVNTFLVYRIDFGHQAGNTSPDKVFLWVNPTPGTQPSDASATTTWTLPTGTYFAFTDSQIRLINGSYWNQTKFDEVRLGVSYVSVAPDPLVVGDARPAQGIHAARLDQPSAITVKSPEALRFLTSAPRIPEVAIDLVPAIAVPSYRFQGNAKERDDLLLEDGGLEDRSN